MDCGLFIFGIKFLSLDDDMNLIPFTILTRTLKSIEGFKKDDTLTRTEAVVFIQRLKENLSTLQSNAPYEQKYVPDTGLKDIPDFNAEKIDEYINLTGYKDVYQIPSNTSKAIAKNSFINVFSTAICLVGVLLMPMEKVITWLN